MNRNKIIALTLAASISASLIPANLTFALESNQDTTIVETAENNKIKVNEFNLISQENYSAYEEAFKVKVASYVTNGGQYGGSSLSKAFDGDMATHWETGKPNSTSHTNEITVTFEEIEEVNRIVYAARKDAGQKGYATKFSIYASLTEDGDDFNLVGSGEATKTANLSEFQFNTVEAKRIKFVFDEAYSSWASASELMFFKEDNMESEINSIFVDGTQLELSAEFTTLEAIEAMEQKVINHPFAAKYIKVIEEAKELLENPNKHEGVSIYTCDQRGDSVAEATEHRVARPTYTLYSYGKYISPGETIKVYVDADEDGVLPKICLGEIGTGNNGWSEFIQLQPGLNLITAPSLEEKEPRAIYIYNGATAEQQAYAPRIRIEGGTQYPVYRHGETDPVEFVKELEEYCAKVSTDLNDFEVGANSEVVYNMAELTSKNNTIATSAKGALAGLKEISNSGLTAYDTMEEWETMWNAFQYFSGFSADAEDARNQIYDQKFNTRILSGGSYGWGGYGYVGFNGGQSINKDSGFFKMVVQPMTYGDNDQWAYIHEWGHEQNDAGTEHIEVTNNLYNGYVSKVLGKKMDWAAWDDMLKRFSGEDVALNFWVNLGLLTQPILYFGDDFYGKSSQVSRTNPDGILDGLSNNQQRIAITYSIASGYNLLDFFEGWGYIEATDLMKEKVSNLPKPDFKLEYIHGGAEDYAGDGFNENITVKVESKLDEATATNKLTFSIDDENKEDLLGYEILKDNEVIGFARNNSFVIENVDVNENATYEVVPYAKDLSVAESVSVRAFTPSISIQQEKVMVALNSDFNAEELVKALNYKGEDISSKLQMESNVDSSRKGTYEVKYTLNDNGIEVSKKVEVEVVSGYDYLSDSEWTSVETQWGTPRKNSNLKGRVNGEIRTFEKGFGIHANGKIVYNLENYNYDTFEALLGVDMTIEAQERSSISFNVIADGKVVATTDTIKHADDMVGISVPVTGVKELVIEVSDSGNGNTSDHGIIANPKLSKNNVKPTLNLVEETVIEYKSEFDIMEGVTANDVEDGDLSDSVEVNLNGFTTDKPGRYNLEYQVTDSDGNVVTKNREVFVYSSSEYVSNVEWVSATTDWSTVKNDLAVGGAKIKLNIAGEEKVFDKGIGTHANSEIIYNLADTNYEYFESYLGVDRNIAGAGRSSVIFKIYADGEEVYNSGLMNWEDEAKFVRVSLENVTELKLVVNNGGNGNASDHASFGDAKFLIANSKPQIQLSSGEISTKVGLPIELEANYSATDAEDGDITASVVVTDNVNFNKAGTYTQEFKATDSDGNTTVKTREVKVVDMKDYTYLSDINWKSGNAGSALRKDVSTGNTAMRLLGENGEVVNYSKGIGTHSYSTIIYDLSNENYDYFSSFIGIDRQMINRESSVEFQVYLDGEKAYDSGLVQANDVQQYVEFNITGVKELKLVVTDYDGTRGADWANWADAKLYYAEEGIEVDRNSLNSLISTVEGLSSDIYVAEGFENLTNILAAVKESLADGYTQEEINELYEKLNTAYEALEVAVDLNEVVTITDNELKQLIKETLGLDGSDITIGEMYKLTSLGSNGALITSLEGLQYAKNLEKIEIEYNEITDLSPLKDLAKLTDISITEGYIVSGVPQEANGKILIDEIRKDINGDAIKPTEVRITSGLNSKSLKVDEILQEGIITINQDDLYDSINSIVVYYEGANGGFQSQSIYMFMK